MAEGFDLSSILKQAREWKDRALHAALHATDEVGEEVLGEAQQLCPISLPAPPKKRGGGVRQINNAPGFLKSSATSTPAKLNGNKLEKFIGFNAVYARYQHETPDLNHHGDGQWKYLSIPLNRAKTNQVLPRHVAAAVKEARRG